jgi:hypothetical protein
MKKPTSGMMGRVEPLDGWEFKAGNYLILQAVRIQQAGSWRVILAVKP